MPPSAPASRRSRPTPAFRRSPHVVSFWQDGKLVIVNYSTGIVVQGTPLIIEMLDELAEWRTWKDLASGRPLEEQRLLRRLVELMVERTFVTRSTQTPRSIDSQLSRWGTWNPIAGFFHLATKNVAFRSPRNRIAAACERARTDPLPPSLKSNGNHKVPLPRAAIDGELPAILLARRTWRNFGRRRLALADLATLLQLTWGVHGWIEVPRLGKFALKTSPSGGARHSIEVYVDARKVAGLRPGLYHYNPDTHRLAPVGRSSARRISDYLPGQTWYDAAAAVLLMTAVFERVQWRYPYARAYRAILAEAGHLCQTFCLVATWLRLAPFCTMAFTDSRLERDLKIDGVSESVLYAAGVGARPDGVEWAPWPGTDQTPTVSTPSHANGSRDRRIRTSTQRPRSAGSTRARRDRSSQA
jgi:SagB-type dehydrogenase family enzyme